MMKDLALAIFVATVLTLADVAWAEHKEKPVVVSPPGQLQAPVLCAPYPWMPHDVNDIQEDNT